MMSYPYSIFSLLITLTIFDIFFTLPWLSITYTMISLLPNFSEYSLIFKIALFLPFKKSDSYIIGLTYH